NSPARDVTIAASSQISALGISCPLADRYQGWVTSALLDMSEFIYMLPNPRDCFLDLQEIAYGSNGTTVYVAQLADIPLDHLILPIEVKEWDRQDRLAQRATLVAVKSVPIMPSGSAKLTEVLHELCIMRGLRCANILSMDALYVNPEDETLWIRMELMTRSLASIIELRKVNFVLSDQSIAGCTKDV
ncbi:hypothetical protein B0H14DRAFT_2188016, partial [Mycena olivaceomarginata]